MLALASMLSAIVLSMGCGAEMTVEKVQPTISSTATRSAAILSGSDYATGGPYKMIQSLGAPISEPRQESSDGRYKVR